MVSAVIFVSTSFHASQVGFATSNLISLSSVAHQTLHSTALHHTILTATSLTLKESIKKFFTHVFLYPEKNFIAVIVMLALVIGPPVGGVFLFKYLQKKGKLPCSPPIDNATPNPASLS